MASPPPLKIVSFDVEGLHVKEQKYVKIIDQIKDYDIALLQQIRRPSPVTKAQIERAYAKAMGPRLVDKVKQPVDCKIFWNSSSNIKGGTAVCVRSMSKINIDLEAAQPNDNQDPGKSCFDIKPRAKTGELFKMGTFQCLKGTYNDKPLEIWNVFALPNAVMPRKQWCEAFKAILDQAKREEDTTLIMAGDWNGVEREQDRQKGKTVQYDRDSWPLWVYYRETKLEDPFLDEAKRRGSSQQYSYYNRKFNSQSRFDRVYAGGENVEISTVKIHQREKGFKSGHGKLTFEVHPKEEEEQQEEETPKTPPKQEKKKKPKTPQKEEKKPKTPQEEKPTSPEKEEKKPKSADSGKPASPAPEIEVSPPPKEKPLPVTYIGNRAVPVVPSEEPEKPETPPEAPDAPEVPQPEAREAPEAPKAPEAPEAPKAPDAPEVPKPPDAPEVPKAPDAPEVPNPPDAPEVPEAPKPPDAPEVPEAPKPPETPKPPEAPKPSKSCVVM